MNDTTRRTDAILMALALRGTMSRQELVVQLEAWQYEDIAESIASILPPLHRRNQIRNTAPQRGRGYTAHWSLGPSAPAWALWIAAHTSVRDGGRLCDDPAHHDLLARFEQLADASRLWSVHSPAIDAALRREG